MARGVHCICFRSKVRTRTTTRRTGKARRTTRKRRSKGCKYGRLKNPVRLPSGGKRYCKRKPKSRRRRRRR